MSSLTPTGKSTGNAFLSAQAVESGGISSSTSSPCLSVSPSTPSSSPAKSTSMMIEQKILNEYELYDEDAPTEDSKLLFL